ncbi:1-deoxy-D-xylulose-5-phosphate reductoisomerase [Propionivibrio dicarboxylicus]|uniref:1-deoxy-D-xylulose 5-phosphate reductoisomerase n=1 Tax=Propionivibrio dicarboxylicus TaxID=83767 RepID=A0A1G8DBJ2_9RHOO|nr:1-deoxy-D-xylulose-5-phosphate reductoisomerase [Propionivibrio dicarboxylicus]SDH54700.1 1-deoxy-D-xylulose 5-phosphate reductoisomerase [Propionivibrio dicarboxylicus]
MTLRQLTVLGSTGSIGVSTLDVVRRHPDRYRIIALCAHRQIDRLFEQCIEFRPQYAVVGNALLAESLRNRLQAAGCATKIEYGEEALVRMSALPEVDTVMAAIVGAAGLKPALAAAQSGKRVLLANKESLVMAGAVFMRAVRENNAVLLPIDSEHNAIFQSLPVDYSGDLSSSGVAKILLTASGGPFRSADRAELEQVTPDQACAHPNWVMGRKISVDSATLMNKGLEVIEAHWLFNVPPERIQVVVHPQSVIHSMVEYIDGSVLAELGSPDMRTPIAHALAYPERITSGVASLDLFKIASLTFERPDFERFPCLGLAYEALRTGGTAPAILNAANEIAVAAFLAEELRFTEIPKIIDATMRGVSVSAAETLEDVLAADAAARDYAARMCRQAGGL